MDTTLHQILGELYAKDARVEALKRENAQLTTQVTAAEERAVTAEAARDEATARAEISARIVEGLKASLMGGPLAQVEGGGGDGLV